MALSKVNQLVLRFRDLKSADFWRYLPKAGWLFFPPLLFLGFAYGIFWHVVQGKDLMVITLEDLEGISGLGVFICFIIALFFWVYVTWYSTRLVAKAKDFQSGEKNRMWRIYKEQTPRIFAFTCLSIIVLAFFQLDNPRYPYLNKLWSHLLLLPGSFILYFIIFNFWKRQLLKKNRDDTAWLQYLKKLRVRTYSILALWLIVVVALKSFWALISLLMGWQFGLVLLLMVRREIIEVKKRTGELVIPPPNIQPPFRFWKRFWYVASDKEDRTFFKWFCIISTLAFAIYLLAVYKIWMAVFIGSFPFVLLAFGVLLGIGNLITFASVTGRTNYHVYILIFTFGLSFIYPDPHVVKLVPKQNPAHLFGNRMELKEYFYQWLHHPDRKEQIEMASPENPYPVYFVLANGGASRSGYWTASLLSKLEDTTGGEFSKHLFCLSGTSGGSVGHATFFMLLRLKEELKKHNQSPPAFVNASQQYLSSDFLTYTLSHLLCTDIFRNLVYVRNTKDRAAALAYALEKAPPQKNILYNRFAAGFSTFITQKNQTYSLPILCINATRVQKGSPALISNIRIDNNEFFNNRIDILSLLDETQDMKLSTAVVIGASFPYISPAGRIIKKSCDNEKQTCTDTSYYFVDGGYFDNSGAGVVNEMLLQMKYLLENDSAFRKYRDKLRFHVLHITNTDPRKINTGRTNPLANDLLAPLQTLMGSYGSQTTVNDRRLKNFLYAACRKESHESCNHYANIDLYSNTGYIVLKNNDTIPLKYSMNWVISDYQRQSMNTNLLNNESFQQECAWIMKECAVFKN